MVHGGKSVQFETTKDMVENQTTDLVDLKSVLVALNIKFWLK